MRLDEAYHIIEELRSNESLYSRGVLNSEGKKALEKLIKIAKELGLQIDRIVRKARRNPTRENVEKLVRIVEEELDSRLRGDRSSLY